ncbi:major facilitator superfamily domain-containing protein, partial [Ochromonadaceae sp. CCMP2298]
LSLAALFLSTPLNGLSPSLSLIAEDFGFTDAERDLYLGGYVGIATMLGQMIGSILAGMMTDSYSRSRILVGALLLNSAAAASFSSPQVSFYMLLILRVIVGGCQGIGVPVIFSLIGDFYKQEVRGSVSAVVSSCLGGGMMLGQLFVGYCLPYTGWRQPFLVLGAASAAASAFVLSSLVDPPRGGKEEALEDMLDRGIPLPPMSTTAFVKSMMLPTVVMLVLQTVPNTVPWGVLSTHLHDVLATDAHLSMQQATSLIAIFGAGAATGGVFGGFFGAYLYQLDRRYLPLFMGTTLATSSVVLRNLLQMDLTQSSTLSSAMPLLLLSGALAAVNGANIRVVMIDLNSPEARGSSIAVLSFVNCAGRGCGPAALEAYMS